VCVLFIYGAHFTLSLSLSLCFEQDAENEWKRKKEESQLHVIIIDEIDALCRTRGSSGDGGAHRDSVVNQLLSKLDGLENKSNVLVIGNETNKQTKHALLLSFFLLQLVSLYGGF